MPTGLHIRRVRTPLGVIGVIYESRPNVTADAGALCLKSGNAVILRGGSESFHSSGAIHACLVARPARRRPARGGDPACAHPRPRRGQRDAAGRRAYRRHRAPRRQGPCRAGPARGAGAGLRPPGGHLPRLRRRGGRPGEGAGGRAERQDPPDRHLRRGGMPADRPRLLGGAGPGADRATCWRRASRCRPRARSRSVPGTTSRRPRTTSGANSST